MFQLTEATACKCTNANPRTELHGEDRVRAIDLTFELTTDNAVLDLIAPGLREHFYCNRAAMAAQGSLPDVAIPLPDIRYPQLKTEDIRWEQPKSRGYRWIWDWGRDERHVDFTDAALASLSFSVQANEVTEVKFTVSYNGDELNDNEAYGELCGLATMGDVHIQLFAPAAVVPVKKGWRSGKADAPPPMTDGGAPLLDGPGDDDHDDDDTGNEHPADSPEAAAQRRSGLAIPDQRPGRPQYPTPPTKRRSRRTAAA